MISTMHNMHTKLSERRVALTMPASELIALDDYCANCRRATGEPIARADVIRQAVRELIEQAALKGNK